MNGLKILAVALLTCVVSSVVAQTRIEHNGQEVFLNGLNLAWGKYPGQEEGREGASFGDDIGPTENTPNLDHFQNVFGQMQANGANIMRLWLHTTGQHTPAWDGSTVTGPGTNTIEDLKVILDLAWEHDIGMMLCLWSFDMLRIRNGDEVTGRAKDILTNEVHRASYVKNSLIPMVEALKGHPGIICWEIFNEPEGMSNEFGWRFNHHVPMSNIQAFVNVCAGAIHRADPQAKVTNGSWSFDASTDEIGYKNYYTDERLIEAGGDNDGTLDFYCVHYYDWAREERSPFLHPASYWKLDKPLVIAEFHPSCRNCTETPYESLYQGGYAGALAWSWTDAKHDLMLNEIKAIFDAHPEDVKITKD